MKFYVIAGEASGDLHGHNLIKELKILQPNLVFRGIGGDLMQNQGMQLVEHIRNTNIMGFIEVAKKIVYIWNLLSKIKRDILDYKPDAIILIDYPGFNLRLAKFAKQHNIKVFYYISPQLWAWKKGRIQTIKKYVDKLFVVLPFEKDFYKKEANIDVEFVGHPLLDAIAHNAENQNNTLLKTLIIQDKPILALLPGSRKQEIQRILPIMLEAAAHFDTIQTIVAGAPNLPASYYQPFLKKYKAQLIHNQTYPLLQIATAAAVTSGTATLETALHNVPQAVCYKANPLSFYIARKIVNIPYISLPNLILNKPAVKELIQKDLTIKNLTNELSLLLFNKEYQNQLSESYQQLYQLLGGIDASKRTAQQILNYLK